VNLLDVDPFILLLSGGLKARRSRAQQQLNRLLIAQKNDR
jgi:hypothetical protein